MTTLLWLFPLNHGLCPVKLLYVSVGGSGLGIVCSWVADIPLNRNCGWTTLNTPAIRFNLIAQEVSVQMVLMVLIRDLYNDLGIKTFMQSVFVLGYDRPAGLF